MATSSPVPYVSHLLFLLHRTSGLPFLVDTRAEVSIVLLSAVEWKNGQEYSLPAVNNSVTVLLLLENVFSSLIWVYVAHFHGCLLLSTPDALSSVRIFFQHHFILLVDVKHRIY